MRPGLSVSPTHRSLPIALTSILIAMVAEGCSSETTITNPSFTAAPSLVRSGSDINVNSVAQLYAAVNNPENAGRRIIIAVGTYNLDSTQTNGGRLELQRDMEISGPPGRRADVILDASNVKYSSPTQSLTGAIRIGRGINRVKRLTIRNTTGGAAAIETDLNSTGATHVDIEDVTVVGAQRGIDIRNLNAPGRVLTVELNDNDLSGALTGNGQGIRILNTGSAGASIQVDMRNNRSHHNYAGCLVANLSSSNATIAIDSHNDRFTDNGVGCVFLGGNAGLNMRADSNSITFRSHGGRFQNNTGPLAPNSPNQRGGIIVQGGTSAQPGQASYNAVSLQMWGYKFGNNAGPSLNVFGAWTAAATPAGVHNTATVMLNSARLPSSEISRIDSSPFEPALTNRATVTQ